MTASPGKDGVAPAASPQVLVGGTGRLDADQRSVLEHTKGHLLVLGGAGTGKSTALVELLAARLRGSAALHPGRVVALARDRRSAAALARSVGRAIGSGQLPHVSTFHAFALDVVRRLADPHLPGSQPRLLPATEQEALLRELLDWSVREGRVSWPSQLARALPTHGIVEEVRTLLARARMLGLDGADLARIGRRDGVRAWAALGPFLTEYLDVLALEGALDYSELLQAACAGLASSGGSQRLRVELVVVDELEEADPGQVRLLQVLAARGAQVVGFADPDQAIHGFRGAGRRTVQEFPERFRGLDGSAARVAVLRHGYRTSEQIAAPLRAMLSTPGLAPLSSQVQRDLRLPRASGRSGEVRVLTRSSAAAEAASIAGSLLAARAGHGVDRPVAWSQMAVVVRSPSRYGQLLASSLREAGIPCSWADRSLPLATEPIVVGLFDILRLALADPVADDAIRALLASAFGGLDPLDVRRLTAVLRAARMGAGDGTPSTGEALREALLAGIPAGVELPPRLAEGARRLVATIDAAREAVAADAEVHEVLWAAWSATDAPERMRARALADPGGAADRALDAAVEFFDRASRLSHHQRGGAGVRAFCAATAAQRLAGSTGRVGRQEVSLLSAHATKGRQWEVVVVAGLQEGSWPGLRRRGGLLGIEELGARGRVEAATYAENVDAERRLLYVAGSRARSLLLLTAVDDPSAGSVPSRFLAEVGAPVEGEPQPDSVHLLSESALVIELRRASGLLGSAGAGADSSLVGALGRAAVERLATLAQRPGSPADPARWWCAAGLPGGARHDTGAPDGAGPGSTAQRHPAPAVEDDIVSLPASSIATLLDCPLRWFLERRAGVTSPPGTATSLGILMHSLAEAVALGEIEPRTEALAEAIDAVWPEVPLAAEYLRGQGRKRLAEMASAFLAWHTGSGRRPVAVEVPLSSDLMTAAGRVRITGKVDRIDRDADGALHLVDLKTGRTAASAAQAAAHPQLGAYQLAFREGSLAQGLGDRAGGVSPARLAGAELVHVGDAFVSGMPKVRHQAALAAGDPWADELVAQAARAARGPHFPARPGPLCRTCRFRSLCPARTPDADLEDDRDE